MLRSRRQLGGGHLLVRPQFHPFIVLTILQASKDELVQTVESLRALIVKYHEENQKYFRTIEALIRGNASKQSGGRLSSVTLRPPVPPFDAPSPSISNASAVSTTSTSSGINVSKLSLRGPNVSGPSEPVAGPSKAQGESSDTCCTWPAQLIISGHISGLQHLHPAHQALPGVGVGVGVEGLPVQLHQGHRLARAPRKGAQEHSISCFLLLSHLYNLVRCFPSMYSRYVSRNRSVMLLLVCKRHRGVMGDAHARCTISD
jgi:hypothetical protein